MSKLTITCMRWRWSSVRDVIKKLQFDGYELSYIESSGWILRDFHIKGEYPAIMQLKKWCEQIGTLNHDAI